MTTNDEQRGREEGEELTALRARVLELEKREAQLLAEHELDRRLAAVVRAMPDGVGLAEPDSSVIFVNEGLRRMAGMDDDELPPLRIASFHPADTHKMLREQAIAAAIQHGAWMGEVPILRRDGGEVPTVGVITAHKNKEGELAFLSACFRDLTAQKAAETELERFFDLNADLFSIVDFDGKTCRVNNAWEKTLGYSVEELLGMSLLTILHPDDQAQTLQMSRAAKAGPEAPMIRCEHRMRHKDGSYRWLESRVFISATERKLYSVARDMTDRKLTEETIRKQSAALLELSTPLIPISRDIVVMPLVGTLDSGRIAQVMDNLLEGIGKSRAKVAILDITGVSVVDTQVATALIRAAKATALLGAEAVLTGIRPFVAQTLVTLGADLDGIVTFGTLQAGIAYAMRDG